MSRRILKLCVASLLNILCLTDAEKLLPIIFQASVAIFYESRTTKQFDQIYADGLVCWKMYNVESRLGTINKSNVDKVPAIS